MTEKSKYSPGEFCWVELATSDDKAAEKFYGSLFGWSMKEQPMGPDQPPYVMLEKKGKPIGALYANKKVPTSWLSYVSVVSADASAKKVKSLGGTLVAEPFDVMDAGRMAVAKDPQGARFAVWQLKQHIGAQVINEPGSMCWNELYTPDIAAARTFYSALFGWKPKISPEYTELHLGDAGVGGMMEITGRLKGMPPHWMPYFAVADCDAATKKAESLGGKNHHGPMDIPKVGRFSVLADPQGADFAVITLNLV